MKTDLAIIHDGIEPLRLLASALRREAEGRRDEPELWLRVRDVEGLAVRLLAEDTDLEYLVRACLGGQDFALMSDIAAGALERDARIACLSPAQRGSIRRLRAFLAAAQ